MSRPPLPPPSDRRLRGRWRANRSLAFALVAAILAACSGHRGAGPAGSTPSAAAQLAFGARMAQRGLWNEALFRFEQAERLDPGNARVLNNEAVACEALGKFEQALTTYQRALKADAGNAELKKNYSRFLEFYQGFKPRPTKPEEGKTQEPKASAPVPEKAEEKPPAGVPEMSR